MEHEFVWRERERERERESQIFEKCGENERAEDNRILIIEGSFEPVGVTVPWQPSRGFAFAEP